MPVAFGRRVRAAVRGQVLLPDVEHGSPPGNAGNIGPVVDSPKPSVPLCDAPQDGQHLQFLGSFQGLVAELDDVHAAFESGVHEVLKIALLLTGIGAQVKAGGGKSVRLSHGNQSSSSKLGSYCGSRDIRHMTVRLRGLQRRPLDLIRLVPA